jgi:hypothetical protein
VAKVSSNPIAEGGMRFTFPPYGKKIEAISLQNIYNKNPLVQAHCYLCALLIKIITILNGYPICTSDPAGI